MEARSDPIRSFVLNYSHMYVHIKFAHETSVLVTM